MDIIAKIKLAHGQVGYYDDYSKIYLTPSKPEAYITSGTNLYQIKKSIKSGRLKLVEGSLVEAPNRYEVAVEDNVTKVGKVEEKAVPAAEPISEDTSEKVEIIEAEKPKRSRRKKVAEQIAEPVEETVETEILEEIPID